MDVKAIVIAMIAIGWLGNVGAYPSQSVMKPRFTLTPTKSLDTLLASNKSYKEQWREMLALRCNAHLQVGLDSIKMGAIDKYQLDRVSFEPALFVQKTTHVNPRGYGIKVKFTLD